MMKFHRKRYTKYIGNRVQILPFQMVPMMHRKMMPVGMEINSVVTMKGPARSGAQPVVNMWWAHTMMRQSGDGHEGGDRHLVAEERLSGEGARHLQHGPDRRDQDDVHLRDDRRSRRRSPTASPCHPGRRRRTRCR